MVLREVLGGKFFSKTNESKRVLVTVRTILSLWLQKCPPPMIPLYFSTDITILIIISLFIHPWPDHLVLYGCFMFFLIFSKFQFCLPVAAGLYTALYCHLYSILGVLNWLISDCKKGHPSQFCSFLYIYYYNDNN